MRRLAVLALLAALLPAVPAAAYHPLPEPPDRTFPGGCSFVATGDQSGSVQNYTGALYAVTRAYSSNPARLPVTYEYAWCELRLNYTTTVATTTATTYGSHAVAPPVPVAYAAGDEDVVQACLHYAVVDALGERTEGVDCGERTTEPEWWAVWGYAIVDWTFDEANELLVQHLDAAVCAQLAALPPPPPGSPVTVDETGDVHVLDELFWDCPPYAT